MRPQVHEGPLILVNPDHALKAEPGELRPIAPGGPLLERRAATLLAQIMADLHLAGYIAPVSGYRSHEAQRALYVESLRAHGEAFTCAFVALPGHSEHECGLAVDMALLGGEVDPYCPTFPYEGVCDLFRRHAPSYGFIQRYPEGKRGITGIDHEPWHFRYVGFPHSAIMARAGLTLEEYHARLRQGPLRETVGGQPFTISQIKAPVPPTKSPFTLSGDNVDGFILTLWEDTDGR